ncbi:MAG: PQQ-like beta-propeller repeat protein, partial [Verrucomicrobiae bacterium]|nr:PQQ-like beta-propeller repeat protein [Verrucomicrobiae bacterium]
MPILRIALICLATCLTASAADWPMWRHDPGRTADSPQALPEKPTLLWSRQLPSPAPAYRDTRLQFDAAPEPIVLGQRLFVPSNSDDSVTAFDTSTGKVLWKVFADGPVRFAPVAGQGRVIFGSDDGCVYCVKASDGSPVWKIRAVPSERRVMGNERLISVWPVRGGPVLHEGRVYFTAGVWPLEGTFVFCVDAATGKTLWRNDRASYLYGIHPHNAEAFGGLAPQGYLLIDGEDLVVPCSQA